MILLTGATGNVGRPMLQNLVESGAEVRVFARDRTRLGEMAEQVDVVEGDFSDAAALRQAMNGIERMYLHAIGDDNREVEAAVSIARATGVRHIVHLSSLSASLPGSPDAHWFLGREELITGAGFQWTMLRPGFFMSNVLRWVPAIRDEGVVKWLGGGFAPIDERDISAVAAAALTEEGHEGQIYDLTGPEVMDSRGQVAILAEVLQRPVAFEQISPLEAVAGLRERGVPEERVAFATAVAEALARDEQWRLVTDTVERVIHRPPGTFRQWCDDHAGQLR